MRNDAFNVQQDALGVGDPELIDSTPWAARPMAEWRARGYVPDSDDEDEVGLDSRPSAAAAPKASVVPVVCQERKPAASIDRITCATELEHTVVKSDCSEYDASSQEVEIISAREGRTGEDNELPLPSSFGNVAIGEFEREICLSVASQEEFSKTIEEKDAFPPASPGEQLQAEIEYGLQSVKEILGNACVHSRPDSVDRSQTSSPLSSIRSFPEDEETVEDAGYGTSAFVQVNQLVAEDSMSRDHQNDSPARYPGRDLRQRNPIQVHPYALEDARYQQELKARGLKPLRIASGSSGMHRDQAADDSQDQDAFMNDSADAESTIDLQSALHSQNVYRPEVSKKAQPSTMPTLLDDYEELPEFSAILNGDMRHLKARKRRKISHKSPMEANHSLGHRDFHIPELPPADLDCTAHNDMGTDMLEIPPSTPRSDSSNISDRMMVSSKVSGPSEQMTPRGLPTPATSSLTKAPLEPGIETDCSSDSSENSERDHSSATGSSPVAADVNQGKGIQNMQRRIKGVLPASWLTLDLDKQTNQNRPRRPSGGFPVKQSGIKGVAQRVKSSRRRQSLAQDKDVLVFDISDDSSSETGPPLSAKARSAWASTMFEDDDFGGMFLDDVVEDNGIDTMPPALPSSRKTARVPTERQRILHETLQTDVVPQSGYPGMQQRSHKKKKQSMPTGNFQHHRKHRYNRPTPLSRQTRISDAPAFARLRVDDQPHFIRIAARRARTQRDKWRPVQSHEHVRLVSEAHGQDVNSGSLNRPESLIRSQGNKLSSLGRNPTPLPLSDCHLLVRPQISDVPKTSTKPTPGSAQSRDEIACLKTSTALTIRRLLLRQLESPASTTLHDSTTAPESSNARAGLSQYTSLPGRLFSHYQNRCGKGRLTSSLAKVSAPRPAQLEAIWSRGPPGIREGAFPSQFVALKHPAVKSAPAALTPLNQPVHQRPPGRKRLPQHRHNRLQRSIQLEDHTTKTLREEEGIMDLRVGTFFRDLTFAGYDDLVKIIRQVRETSFDSIDCAKLVQLLRIYYGDNNMDEPFAERSSDAREFLENHRGRGAIQLPTNNDLGFDAFLKLVIITGLQKASNGEKTSSLSNFIFSLIPNSGQLMRKDQDHNSSALRPLQNRHDLYSALYFVAPLETKIRLLPQISSLVDLKESHISACSISLGTLVRLTRFQISSDDDPHMLYNFGKLFQDMVKKMEEQFDAARLEALTQAGGTLSKGDSLRRIMRFNQEKIQDFLTSVLRAWSGCLRSCRTVDQARCLLLGDDLRTVLGLCNRTIAFDASDGRDGRDTVAFRDEVIELILSIITYIVKLLPMKENSKDFVDALHFLLKNVLSTQLGRYEPCSDQILQSLTCCWHALARVSVRYEMRSWDTYLSLGGRDAWQTFDDTWHKRQCEVYFAARFIESNPNEWQEWQVPMLQLWTGSLLVPEAYFKYQADLTTQIVRFDGSWNPLLFHLPLLIHRPINPPLDAHYNLSMSSVVTVQLDELIASRTTLVLALIRNMNNVTMQPDSQDFCLGPVGPNKHDYSAMLKNMMALMRQYLRELEGEPSEQKIYADFVGLVLSKMRVCTAHLEPVPDDFEYMPGKFLPVALDTIRAKLGLYRQQLSHRGMEKHMIVFLHTAAERAAVIGQQEAFEKQLVNIFLDLSPESLEDSQGHAADARFRTLFFQNVFPAYLDRIFYGSGFIIARPALGCILSVYKGLRFRFGLWTPKFLEPFLRATLSLLATLKTTLAGSITSPQRILTDPNQLNAFGLLCSIMCEILRRSQEVEDSFGPFDVLADIWEYFLFFYQYTLRVAFRPPRALPEELRDEQDETLLSEPKLSATDDNMLAYSRRELGDILDFKWVPGYGGTWFVNRAGGRKEQAYTGGVGDWEQEMLQMERAAERYVLVFAQLWSAQ